MTHRNSISLEELWTSTELKIKKVVGEGTSMWRTYFIPQINEMLGKKKKLYKPESLVPLKDFKILDNVSIGEFYFGEQQDEDDTLIQDDADEMVLKKGWNNGDTMDLIHKAEIVDVTILGDVGRRGA